MTTEIYSKDPIGFHGSIPVFSTPTAYSDSYEQVSSDHLDSLRKNGTNPFIPEDLWVEYENSTINLVKKYSKPGDRILDVGVGLGRLLSNFPNLEKYGMDISFGYLEIAQTKGINVCYSMVEDMPYKEGVFDIVVCTDVLEHVLDLNKVVAYILSVTKEGGTLIVRVPYRENLSWYASPKCPYKYSHIRNFDEHSLCLLFEKVFDCKVLDIVMVSYILSEERLKYTYPFFPRGYHRLEHWLTRLKSRAKPLYNLIVNNFYNSIEINVVIKKAS